MSAAKPAVPATPAAPAAPATPAAAPVTPTTAYDGPRVRVIHVGLGGWGGDWARNAVPRVAEIEVAAIVDPSEPTREKVRSLLGLPAEAAFASLADALAAVEADAVIVTAPAVTHAPLALEALEAGKHVIVEKPFANSTAEAAAVVRRGEELGLIVQVSQNYRWYPAPRRVRELLAADALGEVATIEIDFRQWDNDEPDDYPHYRFPQPIINDMAIHHFDLIRMVTGREAVRVFARTSRPSFSHYRDPAVASMVIELEGGLIVDYRGSWLHRGPVTPWAGEWRISGEDGELTFTSRGEGVSADRVGIRDADGAERDLDLETLPLIGRAAGLRAFALSILGGPPPETSGRDNLGSLALMEAAGRSAESGRFEDVRDPLAE
ncbi:Gfo/Idh/MocA family protein [Clavibacter michiganensis]|uniref:Gfo/Idh/MocA family protein n=1 Tax=Clavibacter michiganensis TaxID=28447 RepID=UPI000B55C22A|nr:Gfo/Idh/MocA family oxidoreductase [Clavibacter michiganensis]MDO4031129.1 Gfo/Idh/MocA family oxidoreductase [Clavibacter michiganensis]MDO4043839.1 Gfo/Idh/MocA family oxidoreductase [Clavibacter michiganensis]MDO4052208.1 Gfo/Idh/MocA family oxidoreductase [Clavibacter michiganensis]MDO4056372.1 Gfo/Idh/MocA family oxidoreductase [Clavibacter michiganensis]MDO4065229.1 Gfo/Idh/MocA family oxidoreductase [Clavibacter michiganensis]